MAVTPTLYASGTQAATVTTEHQLKDTNAAGAYTFHVDLSNMVAGDEVELRIYQMILTGGASRVVYYERVGDAQPTDGLIVVSDVIGNDLTDATSLRFSLKQTLGTSRNFPWKVLAY